MAYHLEVARSAKNNSLNMFALIIGINEYLNCKGLRGAVSDAKAMKDYLRKDLGVPGNHIHLLLDKKATRNGIIGAFRKLQNDKRISRGDPILIFYSGHGRECESPRNWRTESKVQCLIPHDCRRDVGSPDAGLNRPISEHAIIALISDLAKSKGNNITVMLDCCYAAGHARAHDEEGLPRIAMDVNPDILVDLDDLDEDILGDREGEIPPSLASRGSLSHVLLAACGEEELAYEHEGRGDFTAELLRLLVDCSVSDLTYVELIDRIHLPRQHPQCRGFHRHRTLFDGRVYAGGKVRYPAEADSNGRCVIGAGLAHGIAQGVELTVYRDRGDILAIVEVDNAARVEDFQTTLTMPKALLTGSLSAKLTRVGKIPVSLIQGGNYSPNVKEVQRRKAVGVEDNSPTFCLVQNIKEAKLGIAMENNEVVFPILDPWLRGLGLKKLLPMPPLSNLTRVLGAAGRYYWYLDLTNKKSTSDSARRVDIDFFQLQKVGPEDDLGSTRYAPAGPSYRRKDPLRGDSDVIDFVVSPEALYGVGIRNKTGSDFYLNAFLFNASSMSIEPYYTQPSTGNPEAPLKQNEAFTIGYGNSQSPPFRYWLTEGQDIDVGYLKVFLSTRPIDLTDIRQKSPFLNTVEEDAMEGDDREGAPSKTTEDVRDVWFTVVIPVVQRRHAAK